MKVSLDMQKLFSLNSTFQATPLGLGLLFKLVEYFCIFISKYFSTGETNNINKIQAREDERTLI